jgi:hypothetical protein
MYEAEIKNGDTSSSIWGKDVEALDHTIKKVEQTRWIPCSERLPEEDGDYLVTTKWKGSYSGNVYIETHVAYYRKKSKEWDYVDIIAWMPLPEPYKEENNEQTRT